jgi:hypothetical protein
MDPTLPSKTNQAGSYPAANNGPFLPYVNLGQGIRIDYPAKWRHTEQNSPAGFMVGFISPQEDPSDTFCENINLYIQPIPPGMSLEQYVKANLDGMRQAPFVYQQNQKTSIAGFDAYRLIYTGPLSGMGLSGKYMQFLFLSGTKGYVLTYTAQMGHFDTFLPTVEQMISTLAIR